MTTKEEIVLEILQEVKQATTAEIIKKASKVSDICVDQFIPTLNQLKAENKVKKTISKEKKGLVWELV